MSQTKTLRIHEIGPRDGLQNIEGFIPTEDKEKLIEMLADSGVSYLESTAFVSPKWVPQLADAEKALAKGGTYPEIRNSVLVPNMKGYERAVGFGAKEVVAFLSASEIHNRANVNKSVAESLEELKTIGGMAVSQGVIPRVNIATAFGYRPEESITADMILSISISLQNAGYRGITLCDTTGVASPDQVYKLCNLLVRKLDAASVAVHFHQCGGIEFANTYAAYRAGIEIFESAAGGLGGCPYAPEADGNIPTEMLVKMFTSMGFDCGIKQEKIDAAAAFAKGLQTQYSKKQASAC